VLSDGIRAFFDHSSLLLLADHFEVSDDSSQFGDQGHRANGVVVGRFLFLEGKAEQDSAVVDGEVKGLIHEHVAQVDVGKLFRCGLLNVCFQLVVAVSLRHHAKGQKLAYLSHHSFAGLECVLWLYGRRLWFGVRSKALLPIDLSIVLMSLLVMR
jgi:hypothetical protein